MCQDDSFIDINPEQAVGKYCKCFAFWIAKYV